MKTRAGGKFGTSHSTMSDAAAVVADMAAKCDLIKRVIHGPYATRRGSSGGSRKVKVTEEGHVLKVQVTSNASHQILYVHSDDRDAAKKYIEAGAKERGFMVKT